MANRKHQVQLRRLFHRQDGKCHWCECEMLAPGSYIPKRGVKAPKNLCTYDHGDSRLSQERGSHAGEYRNVAACWQCNHDRNSAEHQATPREELWRRAGHYDRMTAQESQP
jgi:hypothetical protein